MAAVAPRNDYVGFLKGRVIDCGLLQVGGVPISTVAKTGSASDITTGTLPAAQVPPLDASKIATGTISLQRLPPSSSNIFTGNNQVSLSGTGVLPFSQGGFFGHNRDGSCMTLLANNRGQGAGGWEFVSYASTGAFESRAASLSSAGALTLASVQAGSTLLGTDGSITAGGVLSLSQGSALGGTQILLGQPGSNPCQHRLVTRHYPSTLAGNAIDMYLWTWGVDGGSPGSSLGLSLTQTGLGINNTPNPSYGLDCNGSGNFQGVVRGVGAGGLLLRVFDERNTAFPSTGTLPEVFGGRPVDSQIITSINYPSNSAGVAIAPGLTQNYSVAISGFLLAPSNDTYTFSIFVDDGVRVWVNNAKVLDAWQVQSTTLTTSSFVLSTAWVPFRIEYAQAGYGSGLVVSWRGASNNPSYALLAHSNTGRGFQLGYDNIERPPVTLGTTRVQGKAFFSENVGFGGQKTPAYPVDVTGSIRSSADSVFNTAAVGSLGTTGACFSSASVPASGFALQQLPAGQTNLNTVSGQGITFRDSTVIGATYSNGSLRIGDAAAPSATLDVAGTLRCAPGLAGLTVGTAAGPVSSLVVAAAGSKIEAGVAAAAGDLSSSSAAGDAVLRAMPMSTGGQQRLLLQTGSGTASLTVSPTGLLGIGTTSPSVLLDVAGQGHFSSTLQTDGVLFMNNQANSCMLALSSTTVGIPASNSTSYYGLGMLSGTGLRYQVATNASDSHVFMGGTTEIARITNSGSGSTFSGPLSVTGNANLTTAVIGTKVAFSGTNSRIQTSSSGDSVSIVGGSGSNGIAVDYNSRVGIGTLTPGFPIDIVGGARIQSSGAPAALYTYANGQSNQYWLAGSDSNNNYVVSNQNNTGVYLVNGQTSWTSSSDARLKTDVQTIPTGLDIIDRIRPVTFKWRLPDQNGLQGRETAGVIAQELQDILPNIVDDMGSHLGVRYQELIPFLIKAMQELREEVRTLSQTRAPRSVPAA